MPGDSLSCTLSIIITCFPESYFRLSTKSLILFPNISNIFIDTIDEFFNLKLIEVLSLYGFGLLSYNSK